MYSVLSMAMTSAIVVKRLFVGKCIIIAISYKNENRATATAVVALLFCAAA